jgi:hypothetical protein
MKFLLRKKTDMEFGFYLVFFLSWQWKGETGYYIKSYHRLD